MANKPDNKSMADEREAALQAASDEYKNLPEEEQKKWREAENDLQKRMDSQNYY